MSEKKLFTVFDIQLAAVVRAVMCEVLPEVKHEVAERVVSGVLKGAERSDRENHLFFRGDLFPEKQYNKSDGPDWLIEDKPKTNGGPNEDGSGVRADRGQQPRDGDGENGNGGAFDSGDDSTDGSGTISA